MLRQNNGVLYSPCAEDAESLQESYWPMTAWRSIKRRVIVTRTNLSYTVVSYTLCHNFIANVNDKNMNVFDIAKITEASIDITEKHDGRFFKDRRTVIQEPPL